MRARVGEHLRIEAHGPTPERHGEVVALRADDGAPPYKVRWDDGTEEWFFPGHDAHVVERESASG